VTESFPLLPVASKHPASVQSCGQLANQIHSRSSRRFFYLKPKSISTALVLVLLACCASSVCAQGVYSVRGDWIDDHGRHQSLEDWRGSYTVVTMAYGACHRVCSTSLRVVHDIALAAALRHVVLKQVVVGLDPLEDKPADWAALRDERKPWFDDVTFLSGTESSTQDLARRVGVKYWRYGGHVMHDFRIVLVAPDGRIAKVMDKFDEDPSALLP
jgi:cytochrome oxidase Cu insertion factor (SCO1/SenC/PrrC family)